MNRQFTRVNKRIQNPLAPGETAQANKVLLLDGTNDNQGAGYLKELDANENLPSTDQVDGHHIARFASIVPPGFSFSGVSKTFRENGSGNFSKRRGFIVPPGNVYGNPSDIGLEPIQPFVVQQLIDHPSHASKMLRDPEFEDIAAIIAREERLQQARKAFENLGYQPELQSSVTQHTGTNKVNQSVPDPQNYGGGGGNPRPANPSQQPNGSTHSPFVPNPPPMPPPYIPKAPRGPNPRTNVNAEVRNARANLKPIPIRGEPGYVNQDYAVVTQGRIRAAAERGRASLLNPILNAPLPRNNLQQSRFLPLITADIDRGRIEAARRRARERRIG